MTDVKQLRSQIYPLVSAGGEMTIRTPYKEFQWQLQHNDGTPMTFLEHWGKRAGENSLQLPKMPRGTQFKVVLVEVEY